MPDKEKSLTNALPVDVALGKADYIEVVGFSDHKATAAVWHRLLNLGFRLSAGAGTDAMANYASLRGPVGMNRVFLQTGGDTSAEALHKALREGHSVASNGPLLALQVDGKKSRRHDRAGVGTQAELPRGDALARAARSRRGAVQRSRRRTPWEEGRDAAPS